MPNLKEIRTRIASVRSTRKITSAMKMVAASKLRRVQNYILYLRDYSLFLKKILDEVMEHVPLSGQSVFTKDRAPGGGVLIISMGSNKGLCGTYNAFLIKHTLKEIYSAQEQGQRVKLMVIGKKPERFFAKKDIEMISYDHNTIDNVSYESAAQFARDVMDLFLKENLSRVVMVYNRFKNAVVHQLTSEQVLPVPKEEMYLTEEHKLDILYDEPVILEPSTEEVVDYMTRQYIAYNFYRLLLDASASEHGSRMTAMHKATDNADEMIRALTLSYHKARQASVTKELMDIVGGGQRSGP